MRADPARRDVEGALQASEEIQEKEEVEGARTEGRFALHGHERAHDLQDLAFPYSAGEISAEHSSVSSCDV